MKKQVSRIKVAIVGPNAVAPKLAIDLICFESKMCLNLILSFV
jgi:hypothetical protein